MNTNLMKPGAVTQLFKKLDKKKKKKPENIGGKPSVLVFLYENDEGEQFITGVKRCSEKQIDQMVINEKNSIEFTHYSIHICKDKTQQESVYISILVKFPSLSSSIYTKNMDTWKGTVGVKKQFKINKWDLNRLQSRDRNVSLNYNGILYWHIPTIEKLLSQEAEKP